jgi:predicted peroxiredoxin
METKQPFMVIILIALTAGFAGGIISNSYIAGSKPPTEQKVEMSAKKPSVIFHVASDPKTNPHSGFMALTAAGKFADAGSKVFVFFDVKGVAYGAKLNDFTFADFGSSKKLIADLLAKGVRVEVCQHCFHVNEFKDADLMEGLQWKDLSKTTEGLTEPILTFDY